MIKYLGYTVAFQEVPDEITLCLNISNCRFHCKGCHSPELQKDSGADLEPDLSGLIQRYDGITCVCFFGEGKDWDAFDRCVKLIRDQFPMLKVAWYTGHSETSEEVGYYMMSGLFDYIKTGSYNASRGGLASPTTNQRMYKISNHGKEVTDITSRFFKGV